MQVNQGSGNSNRKENLKILALKQKLERHIKQKTKNMAQWIQNFKELKTLGQAQYHDVSELWKPLTQVQHGRHVKTCS